MTQKSTNQNCIAVFASITPDERDKAKSLAKSMGMTFQGWLGQLIKRELETFSAIGVTNG